MQFDYFVLGKELEMRLGSLDWHQLSALNAGVGPWGVGGTAWITACH